MDASSSHDPEFVWYQGAYATGAQYISQGKYMSEAYASIPGFHFTLPTVQSPFSIVGVTVYFENMGCVWAYGPAIDRNANNKNLRQGDTGGTLSDDWYVRFHVLNTPTCNYQPMDIATNAPYDSILVSQYGSAGSFQGYRDIFSKAPLGQVDGCIPTLTNPVRQSYDMSTQTMAHFTSNGAGWIVPTWLVEMTSPSDYAPSSGWSGTGTNNYWACVSLRDVYIDVMFDVPS